MTVFSSLLSEACEQMSLFVHTFHNYETLAILTQRNKEAQLDGKSWLMGLIFFTTEKSGKHAKG